MSLYNKTGNAWEWECFLAGLEKQQRRRVESDASIALAVKMEDYVCATEQAAVVAYGDATDSKAARLDRETNDFLASLGVFL